jgi:hypothetical protein
MEPKHHIDRAPSAATAAGHPAGHWSQTSEVSSYGGSAMTRSGVTPRLGSTSRKSPR